MFLKFETLRDYLLFPGFVAFCVWAYSRSFLMALCFYLMIVIVFLYSENEKLKKQAKNDREQIRWLWNLAEDNGLIKEAQDKDVEE